MGNNNTTPANNNDEENQTPGQSALTEEELRFTQVYSLGGTRFEVDKQKFLFGDSTDLHLMCKHSLNFYQTINHKNPKANPPGDAIKIDKAKKKVITKASYLDDINTANYKAVNYSSNDAQVIATPIHLLLNLRRSSCRLSPVLDSKKKAKPGKFKLNFTFDAMCTCSIKIDMYENLSDFNTALPNTQPLMKIYRTDKIKADIDCKFENLKDVPTLDFNEIAATCKKFSTTQAAPGNANAAGGGEKKSSSFYLIITIYRICPEKKNDKNFQEQVTFVHIDQTNEGLSKTDNWVIKSVRQLCQVGKLQFFLQDIYGIENKKQLNKDKSGYTQPTNMNTLAAGIPGLATNDTDTKGTVEDEDTTCVVCLSEPRDTIMLPCRHLCMCSPCADKLRYQHGTCPFCRNPFQALLRIKAIKNGKTRREYSLAEALNGLSKDKKKKRVRKDKTGGEDDKKKAERRRRGGGGDHRRRGRDKKEDLTEYQGTGFGAPSGPKSKSKAKAKEEEVKELEKNIETDESEESSEEETETDSKKVSTDDDNSVTSMVNMSRGSSTSNNLSEDGFKDLDGDGNSERNMQRKKF